MLKLVSHSNQREDWTLFLLSSRSGFAWGGDLS